MLEEPLEYKALILEIGKKTAINSRIYSEELCQEIVNDIYRKWKSGYNVYLFSEGIVELPSLIGRLIDIKKEDKKYFGTFDIFNSIDFDYQKCYVGFNLNGEIKEETVAKMQEFIGFYISQKKVGFGTKLEKI